MGNSEPRSTKQIIEDIRERRRGGLHINAATDVDVLLAEYDKLIADLHNAPDAPAITLDDERVLQKGNVHLELRKTIPLLRQIINNPVFMEELTKQGLRFDIEAFEAMEKEVLQQQVEEAGFKVDVVYQTNQQPPATLPAHSGSKLEIIEMPKIPTEAFKFIEEELKKAEEASGKQ